MPRTKSILALAGGAGLANGAALASVIPAPNLAFVPYTAGQLADDPTLVNFNTFDIQVVVSSDRYSSADLRARLAPGGAFYIPPSQDSNAIQIPFLRNATGSRYLQVDTMVMAPIFNATRTIILGKSTFAPASQPRLIFPSNGSNFLDTNDPNGTAFEPANDMSLIDVSWADVPDVQQPGTSNGTFTIARLTIKVGSSGTFIGRVGSTGNPTHDVSFTYIFGVPEPASVSLMAAGLGAIALRRKSNPFPAQA